MVIDLVKKYGNFFIFLYFIFIVTVLLSPLACYKVIPSLADFANHLALLIQAKMALLAGQFPLRFAPLEGGGFLYPIFQFYSPTSYIFSSLIYLLITPHNPLIALMMTFWCGMMLGGIYMYRLSHWLTQSMLGALIASTAYLSAPYYYAIVVNGFGSLNEALALGLVPAVLYYTWNVYVFPKKLGFFLKTSLAWYLLITIHIVTFVYAAFFVGLLLLLMTLKNLTHWKNMCVAGLAGGFGCLMAMWYLAPVHLIHHYLYLNASYDDVTNIVKNSVSFKSLLSPKSSFANGPDHILSDARPAVGWVFLSAAFVCIAFRLFSKKSTWPAALLFLFFIAIFMAWSPINFWNLLPSSLQVGQYSWRLLGHATWLGALLVAFAVAQLERARYGFIGLAGFALLIVLALNFTEINIQPIGITLDGFINNPKLVYNNNIYEIDYRKNLGLVDYAERNSIFLENSKFMIRFVPPGFLLNLDQVLPYCTHTNADISCSLIVSDTIHFMELPALFYPKLLKVTVNGKSVGYSSIVYKDKLMAGIKPELGVNNIHIQFRGLPWANWISSVSFFVWAILGMVTLRAYAKINCRI